MPEIGHKNVEHSLKKNIGRSKNEENTNVQPPISYIEALANLFKGNVGTGKCHKRVKSEMKTYVIFF